MPEATAILIAAISARALAQSARRAGYAPLVTDFFGDRDTLEAAEAHVPLGGNLADGIDGDALVQALERLGRHRRPSGLVCGTGFEDRTALLQRASERWRLCGNRAEVVAKLKDPASLSALCARLAIPVPEVSLTKPPLAQGWLAKRIGGSGGSHIKPASQAAAGTVYYQRATRGEPISVLFLADGVRTRLLGFSAQWCSPTAGKPYRYGGAVRPAELPAAMAAALAAAVDRLTASTALIGLNSADFLVDEGRFWLLEVNPRPGATLDIFEPPRGSMFALHISACAGELTDVPRPDDGAKAAAIVYADADIPRFPDWDWPDWTADRPRAASAIKAGEPLCTVYACGAAAVEAKALADRRRELVLAWTRARQRWQRRPQSA